MRKIMFALSIFLVLLLTACSQTKYVCPDGSTVDDVSKCNIKAEGPLNEAGTVNDKAIETVITEKKPIDFGLNKKELPEGWYVVLSTPVFKEEVDPLLVRQGWQEGYAYNYRHDGVPDSDDHTVIQTSISFFQEERVHRAYLMMLDALEATSVTYQGVNTKIISPAQPHKEIPVQDLGEEAKAYRMMKGVTFFGESNDVEGYKLYFYKKNILVTLNMVGARPDFNLLLDMAKQIEVKI